MRRKVCSLVKNGQKVFTGTYEEIAEWLCVSVEHIKYGRKKGRYIDHQYLLVDEGWQYSYKHPKKKKEKKPEMTPHEAVFDYVERHLNEYGITELHGDNPPEDFLDELNAIGYEITWIKLRDNLKDDSEVATQHRGEETYHYVLYLMNEVPKKNNHIIQSIKGIW